MRYIVWQGISPSSAQLRKYRRRRADVSEGDLLLRADFSAGGELMGADYLEECLDLLRV